MDFSAETKVSQIVLSSPASRRILEEAGIDYCCGGGKPLKDACSQAHVPAEQILGRLRENAKLAATEEDPWVSRALLDLTRHIREHHHKYVRHVIPHIRALLGKVREKHGGKYPELGQIERLFAEVAHEMLMHMQKEEQILFPYIDSLERSANGEGTLELPFFQTVRNPIHAMMKEHDSAGDLVRRIRGSSNQYNPPADACATFQAAYQELRGFEEDLHLHVHLENNILFPRAVELEAMIL